MRPRRCSPVESEQGPSRGDGVHVGSSAAPPVLGRHVAAGSLLAGVGEAGASGAGVAVLLPKRRRGRHLAPALRTGAPVTPVELEVLRRTLAGLHRLGDTVDRVAGRRADGADAGLGASPGTGPRPGEEFPVR